MSTKSEPSPEPQPITEPTDSNLASSSQLITDRETRHVKPIDQEYRDNHEADLSMVITNCRVYITLPSNKSEFAKYRYVYDVKCVAESADIWWHDIPSSSAKISGLTAKDSSGHLKFQQDARSESKTVIGIKFGHTLNVNSEYHFEFSYESAFIGFEIKDPFSRTIIYKDLFIHDNPCNYLSVHLTFPEGANIIGSYPTPSRDGGFLTYEVNTLRPLDDFSILIGYRIEGMKALNWNSISLLVGIIGIIVGIVGSIITILF